LDGRFTWKASGGGGVIYVTGPQRYAELVTQMADLLDQKARTAQGNEAIEVFSLKYAWADDLTFTYRDKEVIVPGVATILRNLLSSGSTQGVLEGRQEKQLPHTVAKLKGKGLAAFGESGSKGERPPEMKKEGEHEKIEEKAEDKGGPSSGIPDAFIQPDTRMNAVIVRDEKERMPYYRELIASLDVPVGLVEIQATIIDVNTDELSELGIDWNVKAGGHNKYQVGFNADVPFIPGSPTLITGNGFNLATTITWGDGEFLLGRIRAMEDRGNARILSRPSVLTINNTEALLEKKETFYVKVPGAYEVDLFNVTTGIMLKVTPHIIEEEGQKKIKLIVNIEDGDISNQSVDQIPIVNQSSINTQAVIRENESLLIGGTYHEIEQKNKQTVPVLGRVPLLGLLFQKKDNTLQKMERMFMITPRIVASDSSAIKAATPETR
jgi:type III secretion protein C